jgi:hypothetical protein
VGVVGRAGDVYAVVQCLDVLREVQAERVVVAAAAVIVAAAVFCFIGGDGSGSRGRIFVGREEEGICAGVGHARWWSAVVGGVGVGVGVGARGGGGGIVRRKGFPVVMWNIIEDAGTVAQESKRRLAGFVVGPSSPPAFRWDGGRERRTRVFAGRVTPNTPEARLSPPYPLSSFLHPFIHPSMAVRPRLARFIFQLTYDLHSPQTRLAALYCLLQHIRQAKQ